VSYQAFVPDRLQPLRSAARAASLATTVIKRRATGKPDMRALAAAIPLLLLLSGCAGTTDSTPSAPGPGGNSSPDGFTVPWMRVGDELGYNFTFTQGDGPSFSGFTTLRVLARVTIPDGYGTMRQAIQIRQANLNGSFAEDYFIDANSFRQIKLERRDGYNETATLEAPPPAPLPTKHSYANATGIVDRYADDPLFEDANMFGVFASGKTIPDNGTFPIAGNLWRRGGNTLLSSDPVEARIAVPAAHATWGALRGLDVDVAYDEGETYFETIAWSGDFAATVPFAVRAERTIQANFFGEAFDVTFGLSLESYKPGTGEVFPRKDEAAPRAQPAGERAVAPRFPADGSGDKITFPMSEMVSTLEKDATAIQFFQSHPGSYLYFAEFYDVDTCKFYRQGPPAPGCHWLQWYGIFFAPDDWMLTFWVEKYANDDGTGAAYPPVVARDTIFGLLFDNVGGDPNVEPDPAIVAENSGVDLGERSTYPADALTIAGAIARWKAGARGDGADQPVNFLWTHLTENGYEFEVDHRHWEFPAENPEFFPAYDNMPFELTQHLASIKPDGFVVEHRNYDITIEHR
jgi:hypothetical protein